MTTTGPSKGDGGDLVATKAQLARMSDIAHRPATAPDEVQAACSAIERICEKHGLWPEDYGVVRIYDRDNADDKETLAAIEHYLNEGDPGVGWPPYSLFWIGFHVISTSYMSGDPRCTPHGSQIEASRYQRAVLRRARQRYRDGYYADPFTKEPMLRPTRKRA